MTDEYITKWFNGEIDETPQQRKWRLDAKKDVIKMMQLHDCSISKALDYIRDRNAKIMDAKTAQEINRNTQLQWQETLRLRELQNELSSNAKLLNMKPKYITKIINPNK
jgi:hypothetical protein